MEAFGQITDDLCEGYYRHWLSVSARQDRSRTSPVNVAPPQSHQILIANIIGPGVYIIF